MIQEERQRPAPGWGAAVVLTAAICGGLLALAGRTTLWDRDEARFAQATVEMIASGDFLVPTFNGRLRPDKPILAYWLMSLPMRLWGPTALAARACSAAAMGVAALFTFAIGRRLLTARAGLWAMVMVAASPLALAEGQAATADAVLLAAITAAMACFAAALDGVGARAWLGLGAALGVAQLAKGPVGLAVPGLAIAATIWLVRRRADGVEAAARAEPAAAAMAWRAALAALLGVALFCLWGVPANRASGGELARLGLGRHVVARALGAVEGHGGGGPLGGFPYYALVLWLGFAPWSVYLPAAVSAALGGRLGGRRAARARALLVGWTAAPLVLMAAVATRLPSYILPVWPALALAVGATLEAERQGGLAPRDRRWLRRGAWLLAALAALAGLAALLALAAALAVLGMGVPALGAAGVDGGLTGTAVAAVARQLAGAQGAWVDARALARDLLPPILAVAGILLAAEGMALREHLAGRYRRAALGLAAGVVGAAAAAGMFLAPMVERWKPAPRLAAAVRATAAPGLPVVTFEYGEPSLVFYLQRGPVGELGDAAAAEAWCRAPGPGILVLPRAALERLPCPLAAGGAREIAAAAGFNISKGRFVELVALERQPASLARPGR